jgi:uncharacterized SAM-binding protein YcdF (DUF218 family)
MNNDTGTDKEDVEWMPRGRRSRHWFPYVLAVTMLLATVFFLRVGRWLVREDRLEKAQAIVVLSGRMPIRALEAAKLYRQGYAPQVWLTRTAEPGDSLEEMGIAFVGDEVYNARVLEHEGVPADAIHVLAPPIVNTVDEINAVGAALAHERGEKIIIVTTKAHTRRVRTLARKLANGRFRAIVRAAEEDPYEPEHWWRTSSDALDVVREVLGLLNTWAGLPLHGT